MTELLQQAIAEIEKLTDEQQDVIAIRFLAELNDEKNWQDSFESATDSQWDSLAAMVRKDIASGNTVSLDETFPTQP